MQRKKLALTDWTPMVLTVVLLIAFVVLFQPSSNSLSTITVNLEQKVIRGSSIEQDGKLVLVQVVHRHGARTTLSKSQFWPDMVFENCSDSYPGPEIVLRDETGLPDSPPILDLDSDKLPGGCRLGQLTHNGHKMGVDLGIWLRERYVHKFGLVPPHFDPSLVSLRTTCIQRTILTLQGVLTGFFPDLQGSVSVNASLERFEFEYGHRTCAALGSILDEVHAKLSSRDQSDSDLRLLASRVRATLGLPSDDLLNWVWLYDELAAIRAEGKPLPPGLIEKPSLFDTIEDQAVKHETPTIAPTARDGILDEHVCRNVIKMSIGPLIWRLLSNMQGKTGVHRTLSGRKTMRKANMILRDGDLDLSVGGGDDGKYARWEAFSESANLNSIKTTDSRISNVSRRLNGVRGGRRVSASKQVKVEKLVQIGEEGPSMYIFSGHDSTITPLLLALGLPETRWPHFASSLVYELWQVPMRQSESKIPDQSEDASDEEMRLRVLLGADNFFVRVLYNKKALGLKNSLPGGWMPLSDFSMLLMHPFSASDAQKARICALDGRSINLSV